MSLARTPSMESRPIAIPNYPMTTVSSSGSSGSRDDSPPSSNGFHSNGNDGLAETGVLPTASAKMRRRNERRATHVTNEIMRDSHEAVQQFENVYHSMVRNGFSNPTPQQLQMQQQQPRRQRIDSDDSGKGPSPRNSLQNESEQVRS